MQMRSQPRTTAASPELILCCVSGPMPLIPRWLSFRGSTPQLKAQDDQLLCLSASVRWIFVEVVFFFVLFFFFFFIFFFTVRASWAMLQWFRNVTGNSAKSQRVTGVRECTSRQFGGGAFCPHAAFWLSIFTRALQDKAPVCSIPSSLSCHSRLDRIVVSGRVTHVKCEHKRIIRVTDEQWWINMRGWISFQKCFPFSPPLAGLFFCCRSWSPKGKWLRDVSAARGKLKRF